MVYISVTLFAEYLNSSLNYKLQESKALFHPPPHTETRVLLEDELPMSFYELVTSVYQ